MSFTENVHLLGTHISLEPLSTHHESDLQKAVAEGDLWRAWYTSIPRPEDVLADIHRRLDLHQRSKLVPWAVRNLSTNAVVGVTSFVDPDEQNRRLEIGSTWLAKSSQGTAVNTEAKLLLLQRAFDELDCIAVEFRTHWHNRQSRAAIQGLGAKQDGVLRNHRIGHNGTLRDTVVFSIIAPEWPTVRHGLVQKLSSFSGQ